MRISQHVLAFLLIITVAFAGSELLAAWNFFLREMSYTGEFVTIFEAEVGPIKEPIHRCHNCELSKQRFSSGVVANTPKVSGSLKTVLESGELKILRSTWYIPGFWYKEDGDERGLENILVHRFATFLTNRYGRAITVKPISKDFNNDDLAKYTGEHADEVNMACNMMSRTIDRLEGVYFGCSTVPAAPQILLGPGMWNKSKLDPANAADVTMESLNNSTYVVCVTDGTTFADMVTEVLPNCIPTPAGSGIDRITKLANQTCDIVFLDSPVVTHTVSHYAPLKHPDTGSWEEGPVYRDSAGNVHYDEIACLFPEDPDDGPSRINNNYDLAWHWNQAYKTFPWKEKVEQHFTEDLAELPIKFTDNSISTTDQMFPGGALRWILDKQLLKVAVTNSTTFFTKDETGFFPDLVEHFTGYLYDTYGKEITVTYRVSDDFDESGSVGQTFKVLLNEYTVDAVIGAVTCTLESYRMATVALPFMYGHLGLMVDTQEYTGGEVDQILDLNDPQYSFCVLDKTTAARFLDKYLPDATKLRFAFKSLLMNAYVAKSCMFRLDDHEIIVEEFSDAQFRADYDMTKTIINNATWLNSAFWVPLFRLDQTESLPPPVIINATGVNSASITDSGQIALPLACQAIVMSWVIVTSLVMGLKLLTAKRNAMLQMVE